MQPTDIGLLSPAMQLGDTPAETQEIWQTCAPLYWLMESARLEAGGAGVGRTSHAAGPDGRHLPVICFQYVGAGKVLFHATDETWRWRYRAGDAYFARYWVQTIRSLCRSKLAERAAPCCFPPIAASMPRTSRCGCGLDSPTSDWRRPRTTA